MSMPILYASDTLSLIEIDPLEAAESFNNNGLGGLFDAISCSVDEERNGSYELEMTYPLSGLHFEDIKYDCFIKAKPNLISEPQLFQIYYVSKPINGKVTFKAEHISYRTKFLPCSGFAVSNLAAAFNNTTGLKSHSVLPCPFTFYTNKFALGVLNIRKPTAMKDILGGVDGSIADLYGGEYEFDNFNIRLLNARGTDRGFKIIRGVNMKDGTQEENFSGLITGIYPYWKIVGNQVMLTEKYIKTNNTLAYQRIVPIDLTDKFTEQYMITTDTVYQGSTEYYTKSGDIYNQLTAGTDYTVGTTITGTIYVPFVPTETQLRAEATTWLNKNAVASANLNLTVDFVRLSGTPEYAHYAELEKVGLCDTVTVKYEKLGINATAKVIKTSFDVLKNRYKSIELGTPKPKLKELLNK